MSVTGVDELNRNLAKMVDRYGKAVAESLVKSGYIVQETAKRSIQNKTGSRIVTRYRKGGGSVQQVVSDPNNPPNTDTGALVKSIAVEVQRGDVFVGSGLEYAPHLEFGTSKMTQRPFLNPALEGNRRRISKLISDAMKATTRRGVK
jgi:HK97 gp10 family phage protein